MRFWVFCFALQLIMYCKCEVKTSITILGGTGVLGRCLSQRVAQLPTRLYYSGRRFEELTKLQSTFQNIHHHSQPQYFLYDPGRLNWCNPAQVPGFHHFTKSNRQVLIQNLGVYHIGKSKDQMISSFQVNTLNQIAMMQQLIHMNDITSNISIQIINISSGDGELCFINRYIVKCINALNTPHDLISYIQKLIATFDPNMEYAYGEAPFYSLSKALLNRATVIFQRKRHRNMKIIACCPGNFISPMTTDEERNQSNMLTVEESTDWIIDMIINHEQYEGGTFYRYGKIINW